MHVLPGSELLSFSDLVQLDVALRLLEQEPFFLFREGIKYPYHESCPFGEIIY